MEINYSTSALKGWYIISFVAKKNFKCKVYLRQQRSDELETDIIYLYESFLQKKISKILYIVQPGFELTICNRINNVPNLNYLGFLLSNEGYWLLPFLSDSWSFSLFIPITSCVSFSYFSHNTLQIIKQLETQACQNKLLDQF